MIIVPVATVVVGILLKACVVAAVGVVAHTLFSPLLRYATGRGPRARRSTLDRLERGADAQPAVRITVAHGRVLEPLRLVGARSGEGSSSLLECLHDDGRVVHIDVSVIIAIEEL